MKRYLIGIALLGALSACTETRQTSNAEQTASRVATHRSIAPPFADAAPKFRHFAVSSSKAEQIRLENGTIIAIPASAFVDVNGKPVSGIVDIAYREFRNAADILLSGIPMVYDSAGQAHWFQSAGMMEIRASQQQQQLEVAAGKSLEVAMISAVSGDFNNYYFDEKNGAWDYLSTNASSATLTPAAQTPIRTAAATDLPEDMNEPTLPPDAATPKAVQFNFTVDYSKFAHLAKYENVVWEYAGFEAEGTINPEKNKWIFTKIWKSAVVDKFGAKPNAFVLTLLDDKEKATKVAVKPVLGEKPHAQAMTEYAATKNKYEMWLKELAKRGLTPESLAAARETKREAKMTDSEITQRAFSVAQMGVYNCDRILHLSDRQELLVNVELNEEGGKRLNTSNITGFYLVDRTIQGAFYYTPGSGFMQWDKFVFAGKHENMVLAIDKDGGILVCEPASFRGTASEGKGKSKMTLVLHHTGKKVTSSRQLQNIIMG